MLEGCCSNSFSICRYFAQVLQSSSKLFVFISCGARVHYILLGFIKMLHIPLGSRGSFKDVSGAGCLECRGIISPKPAPALLDSWLAGMCWLCLAFEVLPCSSGSWVPAKWLCWWAGCQCCCVPWGRCLETLLSVGSAGCAASLSVEWLVRLPLIWTICGNLHALL